MREFKVKDVLTSDQIGLIKTHQNGTEYFENIAERKINSLTLGELRFMGAALADSNFAFESDFLKVCKLMFAGITQIL